MAESSPEEDAGAGQSCRETYPDACYSQPGLESQQPGDGDADEVVADECRRHDRLDVAYASEGIGEAQLESVSELVGEQHEEHRYRLALNRSHFFVLCL